MTFKALIVDDEYPARQELRFMLQEFKDIEVVGEATNARETLNLVSALDYTILFLDINMPGINGLELSRAIQKRPNPPFIIFVTAYGEYALQAFEVNAVDYLLKPFDEKRLRQAIEKVRRLVEQRQQQPAAAGAEAGHSNNGNRGRLNRLPVEKDGKTILLDQNDLIYACTQGDSVYLKTSGDQYLTRFTLKELESRLDPRSFFRCHRCYIVNLNRVRELVPFFNGTYTLIMADKQQSEVPVSRNQARKLKNLLGIN
ncbi:LytR/AlgR family response regulator transcription factor [Moorella sp. Hama-1]|uniref:LytR/AlgR family response regulator transcription factor n=1 Tax=Moorella sp. Hama-1 TaxID=2138101 RepID=UPI000D65D4D3|nr:LytTR family DNA-binding domain-containing protein [Moorella sp. Hama-1]MDN5361904.1 two-component system, LytTR family, response regulator LytT [Moorella sp. (in: firmicutes)]BCV22729.1 DNA-binding response regulator [Moorella sp. Hama-1]